MKGREILKFALPKSKEVLDLIWPNLSRTTTDLDHIITHQPSRIGLLAFQRFFPIEKTTTTLHRYGNCVSASLPLDRHVSTAGSSATAPAARRGPIRFGKKMIQTLGNKRLTLQHFLHELACIFADFIE